MAGSFLVPKKGVEIPFDDNANQLKLFFLNSSYISHYLKHVFLIKSIETNILWHLIIREDQIFFVINNNEDVRSCNLTSHFFLTLFGYLFELILIILCCFLMLIIFKTNFPQVIMNSWLTSIELFSLTNINTIRCSIF